MQIRVIRGKRRRQQPKPPTRAVFMTAPDTESYEWIARVLHFSDSALPVGAYAHSFGLEGACQLNIVHDKETLRTFLNRDVTTALTQVDLPLVAHAHSAALDQNIDLLHQLDQTSYALRPTRQLRNAATRIGKQQASLYHKTWSQEDNLISNLPHTQSPVVLGAIMAYENAPVTAALWSTAYQTFSALLQAALKLLPIGPAATQELLHGAMLNIKPHFQTALKTTIDQMGSFNPLWDIAASRHEHAPARLFIS
ncbi:MAG: urease accessory protein UreF [Akkermansiaceae bacterium]